MAKKLPPAAATAAAPPVIVAENLVKTYTGAGKAVQAVRGISFAVAAGSCTGLLGPNGAGKSTTMKLLIGLTAPTSGSLTVLNEPADNLSRAARQRIGLIPQEDNLDGDLSVAENLEIYGRFFGMTSMQLATRVPELLAYMQLSEKAGARVGSLSGGMKRRLTIARALVHNPDVLVLDEPTTGLDPQARVMIWQKLQDLKKQGKTLLLTTHYMDEAQRLCDHIVVIDGGNILDEGSPTELIARHVPPQVFEVHKPLPKSLAAGTKLLETQNWTSEDLGESVLFYVPEAGPFRAKLPDDATYYHRPANLEDVFLRLTGRSLRP